MASITIRNLRDKAKENLRVQAAQSGLSLEAYIREILETVSTGEKIVQTDIGNLAGKYFGKNNGIDLELPDRSTQRDPVRFD